MPKKQVDSAIQAATSKLLKMNKNQSLADDTVMKTMVKAFYEKYGGGPFVKYIFFSIIVKSLVLSNLWYLLCDGDGDGDDLDDDDDDDDDGDDDDDDDRYCDCHTDNSRNLADFGTTAMPCPMPVTMVLIPPRPSEMSANWFCSSFSQARLCEVTSQGAPP